ncbi:DUF309 domain-containing protein, partial [Bacillus sp. JJ1764]|uniref:DUF309 domain-containing protein n=1 Tax=Bacillus sp. JJ1764 TaxID=3122964 RepID=UPI002FFEFDE5
MYPNEYISYLVHFHGDRDYFECHEILEEYWKNTEPGNKESVWVGLILLAVSCYHHRRGNFAGAVKTLEKAIPIFESKPNMIQQLGLNCHDLNLMLKERLSDIKDRHIYKSLNLPIADTALLQTCVKLTEIK